MSFSSLCSSTFFPPSIWHVSLDPAEIDRALMCSGSVLIRCEMMALGCD